jgi:hypothetical protein
MKIVRAGFLGAAVVVSVLVFFAPPVGADSPTPCPDSLLFPVPASSIPQGQQKDHNGNGIVCAKYQDGKFEGGPDDTTDDIVL